MKKIGIILLCGVFGFLAAASEAPELAGEWRAEFESPRGAQKHGLIRISQGVHAYLKEKGVPHIWHVDGNGHDATHWRNSLYYFAQELFRQ
jgi:enterochelin esterase-like enzyme